jgi:hypothetical protein
MRALKRTVDHTDFVAAKVSMCFARSRRPYLGLSNRLAFGKVPSSGWLRFGNRWWRPGARPWRSTRSWAPRTTSLDAIRVHVPTDGEIVVVRLRAQPDSGAARLAGASLSAGLHLADLVVIGITAAIGFTVSLFFATAAFPAGTALAETKMGALLSFSAAPLALVASRLLRGRAA